MCEHQPQTVGAPTALADAEEAPGCIIWTVKAVVGFPIILIRELPTLPLDLLVFVVEKLQRRHRSQQDPAPVERNDHEQ